MRNKNKGAGKPAPKSWRVVYGVYKVSDCGNIVNIKTGRELSQHVNNGYYRVGLLINKKVVVKSVHRLVALGFLGECPIDNQGFVYVVNHKDGNKLNNNIENLEYITSWENTTHYHTYLKKAV